MSTFFDDLKSFAEHNKKFLFACVVFILAYVPTIIWMWDRWFARDTYYSHGWLIPIVTIYLIWQNANVLKKIPRKESGWGIWVIIFGLGIHLVSIVLRIYFSSGFSMLIVLTGMILHFFGTRILKTIAFPVFFLVFMIPLPLVVIANVSFKLKIFAAQISEVLLNQMGIPAVREGSIIKMPKTHVTVDDVCSGLRSLISLTALGSIFAYWLKASMVRRVFLFLMTIPIAVITNVFRIILLSCISEVWGSQYASGFMHDLTGYLVFVLAFILLVVTKALIE